MEEKTVRSVKNSVQKSWTIGIVGTLRKEIPRFKSGVTNVLNKLLYIPELALYRYVINNKKIKVDNNPTDQTDQRRGSRKA